MGRGLEPREGVGPVSGNLAAMKWLGLFVGFVGGLVAIFAGIYLLAHTSETGPTWLEVIAHGSGAFFIACGLYMFGSLIGTSTSE
jgi:hypothetical protein